MNAEWHWYRYEFQARGSIHCHGAATLKSDPGLCRLTERALKGFIAEKQKNCPDTCNIPVSVEIDEGQKAAKVICNYVDTLINTLNFGQNHWFILVQKNTKIFQTLKGIMIIQI
jgi:hypothetical protein